MRTRALVIVLSTMLLSACSYIPHTADESKRVCREPPAELNEYPLAQQLWYAPVLFMFEGVQYQADHYASKCLRHAIRLPDGRYILVKKWLHSNPPEIDWNESQIVWLLPQGWYYVDAQVVLY